VDHSAEMLVEEQKIRGVATVVNLSYPLYQLCMTDIINALAS